MVENSPSPALPQELQLGGAGNNSKNSLVSDFMASDPSIFGEGDDHFVNEGGLLGPMQDDVVSDLGNNDDIKDLSINVSFKDDSSKRATEVFNNEPPLTPRREAAPSAAGKRFSKFGDSIAKALKLADEISV